MALRCESEDVDYDGDLDLICHFNTQETDFMPSSEVGYISGSTYDGAPFEGVDTVKMVTHD